MSEDRLQRPSVLGATPHGKDQWKFAVWAPNHARVELLLGKRDVILPMSRDALGYHSASAEGVAAGTKYWFRLADSHERPDPASRRQPEGVHGPSELVDLAQFPWTDDGWKGLPLRDSVYYELHVGTFSASGNFTGVLNSLDRLKELGVTTIEIMPIAQFPGGRNWGYDGVYPFAVQNSYGTPRELQQLVNAAHERGMAVALDVVYNHLGPEGNYLREFGPYFTDHYKTPWGAALNFDGPESDEVRHFFISSALYWLDTFHIDALRLDAIHSIFDTSATPFLAELSQQVEALAARSRRTISLIAESDLNDARVLRPRCEGGFEMDSQWTDDFHHSVHTLLTGDNFGYYKDFGETRHLAGALRQGWYYCGQYSPHRRRRHGNRPPAFDGAHYTVCVQNHDQVGNRAQGDRLGSLVNFESLKLAAGANLLSPFVPLLFMGEEYGETAPFLYFTSHGDPALAEAVRRGRAEEFRAFRWQGEIADPQSEETFSRSRLNPDLAQEKPNATLSSFYRRLLAFRHEHRLGHCGAPSVKEFAGQKALLVMLNAPASQLAVLLNFGEAAANFASDLFQADWKKEIDSAEPEWLGPGASLPASITSGSRAALTMPPRSFAVFSSSISTSE